MAKKNLFGVISGFIVVSIAGLLITSSCSSQQTIISTVTTNVSLTTTVTVAGVSLIPTFAVPSTWLITEYQALAIAGSYVPVEISRRALVYAGPEQYGNIAGPTGGDWYVIYQNILTTSSELGWLADTKTSLNGAGPYNELTFKIDPMSGDLISRNATFVIPL